MLYKNKNNQDVAIYILKKCYIPEKEMYKLKVKWYNIVNPSNPFYTGIQEKLLIEKDVFDKDWELLDEQIY